MITACKDASVVRSEGILQLCVLISLYHKTCFVSTFLLQDWLGGLDLKFYESKINLNWKPILKSIMAVSFYTMPLILFI